ncbi:GAF domain-containing protein [Sphingomonas fuzhouensis]|uniref:GAF domain-containing protein n=1 Tax=Sphingomonas fuzhouensis TaxID=3106033 RepID=UPI002AFDF853|nr:GAF domain-containing protein [Sphingomonas sp. SGZ-02]
MDGRHDEEGRLTALKGYGVLDTPNEVQFDAIVRDAARTLRTPIALISLIDENRQWFKARVGLAPAETPRSISFCTHAIHGNETMIVNDAMQDDRFATNPLVTGDVGIRFYAGAPLRTEDGKRIGTLCVIDTKAHPDGLRERDRAALESLARRTMQALELSRTKQAG